MIASPEKQFARALAIANDAHTGQFDKGGQPYILHPIRIMLSLSPSDNVGRIVALLHDTVEDTKVTLADINAEFGQTVHDAVNAMTRRIVKVDDTGGFGVSLLADGRVHDSTVKVPGSKPPRERYMAFIGRVSQNEIATRVKLMDIADNMRPERWHRDIEGLNGRYEKAREFLTAALFEFRTMATLDFLVHTKMITLEEQIKRLGELQKA